MKVGDNLVGHGEEFYLENGCCHARLKILEGAYPEENVEGWRLHAKCFHPQKYCFVMVTINKIIFMYLSNLEPTTGLDSEMSLAVIKSLKSLLRENSERECILSIEIRLKQGKTLIFFCCYY